MTAGSGSGQPDAAGGLARHIPVLVAPVVEFLNVRDGATIVDATFGAGGYTRAILAAADCRVIGIDRDQTAIALGADLVEATNGRVSLVEGDFADVESLVGTEVDGVVFDLGVSSMQVDTPGRGFSFRLDGPLDMRMGRTGPTAADVVARASERDLADVIFAFGEERRSRAIARAVVAVRATQPIATTRQLADIVARVVHAKPGDSHPATRTFQALRILVNDELGQLERGLAGAERLLKPGGRLVAVSFHSLEDRIVKTFLAERAGARAGSRHQPLAHAEPATFRILTRRPVVPDAAETERNPRARSAKLRAAERTDATPPSAASETRWPTLADVLRGARR